MKKIISLAIAAALVAPVAAMADATVYGKVRMSLDNIDDGDDSIWSINSHASRLGVKGSEDLGNGLKAVYKMEFGIDIAGNQSNEFAASDPTSARNAYVGLAGGFGTVLIGRHDTPLKMSTGKLDYFADTQADYNKGYLAGFSDRRADGTVAYVSPSMGGMTLAAALVPGENSEANGIADAYSLAGMYSNGGIYAAAAIENADGGLDLLGAAGEPGDHNQWRVGGGFDAGAWKIGAVYENEAIETNSGADLMDETRWALSGGVKVGSGMIKATYQTADDDVSEAETTGWALGYDHNLSKRTQVYALYLDSTTEMPSVADDEVSIFSIGMNHSF